MLLLRLYVIGRSDESNRMVTEARALLGKLGCTLQMEIVDVMEHPGVARRNGIVVFPAAVLTDTDDPAGPKLVIGGMALLGDVTHQVSKQHPVGGHAA